MDQRGGLALRPRHDGLAAYAGEFTTRTILSRRDAAGISGGEALDAIGYRGRRRWRPQIGRFVELHIEQGPILEAEGKTIGVVEGGQGIVWFDGTIVGFESHAGTTPMPRRRDALLGLAEFALSVEGIAVARGPSAVATIGEAVIGAPSRNVVPGPVRFTLDLRDPKSATLDSAEAALRDRIQEIADRRRLTVELTRIGGRSRSPSIPRSWTSVEAAAGGLGLSHRRMVSGAGHDACNLAGKVPTAMIFVPCRDGVSHNESESATRAIAPRVPTSCCTRCSPWPTPRPEQVLAPGRVGEASSLTRPVPRESSTCPPFSRIACHSGIDAQTGARHAHALPASSPSR